MDVLDAIAARRQVRQYTDQPVDPEAVAQVLEAATRAPSAMNRQRWDFVVVDDPEQIERLSGVWRGAAWTAHAPVVVALVVPTGESPDERTSIRFDLGQLAMLLMIAATGVGLASGQANCRDQDLARSVLGFPEDHECAMLVALGHPAGRPIAPVRCPDRRPLDEVVHRGRW